MTPAPNRRWFRFSLRGLLAVGTLFGLWMGWELRTVSQRRATAERFEAEGGFVKAWTDSDLEMQYAGYEPGQEPKISIWRRWLGDRAFDFIALPAGSTQAERKRARVLFPEANFGPRPMPPELLVSPERLP